VCAGGGDEAVEVAQGVAGLVLGQVLGVGDPPAGSLAGVHLDQLPVVEELDQGRIGADVDVLSDVGLRCGVQRLADLDVEVAVHLDPGEDRHVIRVGHG
jgi:hypothetical protein